MTYDNDMTRGIAMSRDTDNATCHTQGPNT